MPVLLLASLLLTATPAEPDLTAQHAPRFADAFVEVYPARVARTWHVPFATSDRSSYKTMGVVSGLGAYRASYVRGHLHSGADLVPRGKGKPFVHVLPVAWGAVCSIHLGAPHATVVLKHRLADGAVLFTSYKHLAEVYIEVGQQVSPEIRLGRLYTRREARALGGNYDHLHLEVKKNFDDYGAASWTTMSEDALQARFHDPVAFLKARLGKVETVDVFDAYLDASEPIADGFDFPVGDRDGRGAYRDLNSGQQHQGWYVATGFGERYSLGLHPGEDWNGKGGGASDLGQPVRAVAAGRVLFAGAAGAPWGNVVLLQHVYYENHRRQRVQSLYAHLERVEVEAGQQLKRRQRLGSVGQDPDGLYAPHLHLELRRDETLAPTYWPSSERRDRAWVEQRYTAPTDFIATRRQLLVPQQEENLLLVDQASFRMRRFARGALQAEHDIALGQAAGRKRQRGDLKTPKGLYHVIGKSQGPFAGPYGDYYGGHWIKLNYPNAFDAADGLAREIITAAQAQEIASAWQARALTPQGTRLGSGIGFHGWIEEWDGRDSRHLSWGCVVVHLRDIASFYAEVPVGAAVVMF